MIYTRKLLPNSTLCATQNIFSSYSVSLWIIKYITSVINFYRNFKTQSRTLSRIEIFYVPIPLKRRKANTTQSKPISTKKKIYQDIPGYNVTHLSKNCIELECELNVNFKVEIESKGLQKCVTSYKKGNVKNYLYLVKEKES